MRVCAHSQACVLEVSEHEKTPLRGATVFSQFIQVVYVGFHHIRTVSVIIS